MNCSMNENPIMTTEYNFSDTPPSVAIVESIAEIENKEPTEVDFTLYDYVDPEALDALFKKQTGGSINITTRIDDYKLSIMNNAVVKVFELTETEEKR